MYLPRQFREDRIEVLHAAKLEIGAAAVVSHGPDGPIASHVPIELDPEPAPWGTIRCHFVAAAHGDSTAAFLRALGSKHTYRLGGPSCL